MEKIKIEVEAQLAKSIREFVDPMTTKRRIGLVYYQKLSDGGLIARSLSHETDKDHLIQMMRQQKIYIPTNKIIAENT
jgi:hypothetical protein